MEQLEYLWKRYSDNTATPAEREELYQLIQQLDPETSQFFKSLEEDLKREVEATAEEQQRLDAIYSKIEIAIRHNARDKKVIKLWPQITRIAAAVLLVSVSAFIAYTYFSKPAVEQNIDFVAGTEKAMLQLADGTTVPLNGKTSAIPNQGIAQVQSADGQLSYIATSDTDEIVYNSIKTPRGGQYQLTLADGSKVELNAASSLRFPTAFSGNERVVELVGEAYFEIASLSGAEGKKMPFRLRLANGAEIEVLGTHFNVMAYAEETAIKTTLVEGSVKVTNGSNSSVLSPNQQAIISKDGLITIENVNVNQALAWKNNKFVFKNTGIEEIMRQLSRWYDIDVNYEGDVKDLTFSGTISRKENASAVLSLLELTGTVKFKTQGRTIIVMKAKQSKTN